MGSLVSLGGALFPEAAVRAFSIGVDKIAGDFGIPAGEEIKWSPKKGSWIHENLHGDQRQECYREILELARSLEVRVLVIVWDTGRTTLKGERAFDKCIDFAFERLSVNLSKRDEQAIFVADRPGGGKQQEESLLQGFLKRLEAGTEYAVPDWCALNILTTPSKHLRQLQLADLVTGITTAMVAGQNRYAAPLFPTIQEMMLQNFDGYIGGTGLKLFPDGLRNLYHWVLGEQYLWRVSASSGIPLPISGAPYSEPPGVG